MRATSTPTQLRLAVAASLLVGRGSVLWRSLIFVGLAMSLSGCGLLGKRVSAFEKANLAKPGMALVAAPKEQAHMNHMFNAREGSVGGFGGAGGGCGCN
jgi:hypothetical protein